MIDELNDEGNNQIVLHAPCALEQYHRFCERVMNRTYNFHKAINH